MNAIPLLFGAMILGAGELGRAYQITGLAGLAIFFLPVLPAYLLLAGHLHDRWERFLIASSAYISMAGLAFFALRMLFFIPLTFSNVLLVAEAIGIILSSLLSFRRLDLKPRLSFDKSSLPIFALLLLALLFYSSAAAMQDSWQKELRQVKWATDVFQASEGGASADILQFSAHTPFHAMLGTVTMHMFGFSQYSKTLEYAIFGVFDVLMLVLLGKFMLKKREAGIFAALFFLSSALFLHYTTIADYVAPAIYFQLLTFYALYRYLQTREDLFFYALILFFSSAVYAKADSAIFIAPISAFLLLKKITFSRKDLDIGNLQFKRAAILILLTALIATPIAITALQSDAASQGKYGPLWRIRHFSSAGRLETITNLDRFGTLFAGNMWGYAESNDTFPLSKYVPMLLSGEIKKLESGGRKVFIQGGDNSAGAFYETPQMYLLYAAALLYFSYRKLREHAPFIIYMWYGILFPFIFFPQVGWNFMALGFALGFIAMGYLLSELMSRFKGGNALNAALLGIFAFVLASSFIYSANTIYNFNYYSGINFYRDALLRGDPVFGAFALSRYIREHTTAAETYAADICYLSEGAVNRNAWTGAAPPSYTILPTEDFPNSRAQSRKEHGQNGYTELIQDRPPTAIFMYKGFQYAELYRLFSKTRYLDEGVCIEASEYGKNYNNWGLFFSDPAGIC